jgi:hypothetical protein
MSNHTPGPWRASDAYVEGRDMGAIRHNDGALIAVIWDASDRMGGEREDGRRILTDEQEANAALIAASPDMYAALQSVHMLLVDGQGDAQRIVRAALDKADGK